MHVPEMKGIRNPSARSGEVDGLLVCFVGQMSEEVHVRCIFINASKNTDK
jgi:hypothetical protein